MRKLHLALFFIFMLIFNLTNCFAQEKGANMSIQKGSQVSFNYTLTVDGEIVDSSEGKKPFQYTHGEGKIIPGLSRQLEGLRVGDKKTIVIPPEEAYGKANPNAFQEIAKSQLPAGMVPHVGMVLQMRNPKGGVMLAKVAEVKEKSIVIDLNHPLAGKTLNFQVEIVSIK